MWARLNDYKAVNLNTGVSLEIEQEEKIVYKNTYIFKKILFDQQPVWEYTGQWILALKTKGVYHKLFHGSKEDCMELFEQALEEITNP